MRPELASPFAPITFPSRPFLSALPELLFVALQVPRAVRAPDPVHHARRPQHIAVPHDEGGGAEAGAAAQLPAEEGRRRRVEGVQETEGLQLHDAHAHSRDHGKEGRNGG